MWTHTQNMLKCSLKDYWNISQHSKCTKISRCTPGRNARLFLFTTSKRARGFARPDALAIAVHLSRSSGNTRSASHAEQKADQSINLPEKRTFWQGSLLKLGPDIIFTRTLFDAWVFYWILLTSELKEINRRWTLTVDPQEVITRKLGTVRILAFILGPLTVDHVAFVYISCLVMQCHFHY